MIDRLRVAAGQFAATTSLDANLDSCRALIQQAADGGADLVVLPEFANHISVYESAAHCRSVAVEFDGPWLSAICADAASLGLMVSLAVTVPRDDERVTITNVLVGADGSILASADKQTLMGNERAYLSGGACVSPVADTPFGPIGIYACMDGVTFETPRTFAVRGARLLLNSLNSFALDEASLHIPVRAVENGVFVVAANKVGPLLPADQVTGFSEALGIPPNALDGAGESQIVAPDGAVLAIASRTDTEVIFADIDLGVVEPAAQRFSGRRPELYAAVAKPSTALPREVDEHAVAVQCLPGGLPEGEHVDAQLIVLPEGSSVPPGLGDDTLVITSAFEGNRHVGQIWDHSGLLHEQPQLHRANRLPGVSDLGDAVELFTAPFGDIAVFVGDDHRYPEVIRLAAIAGAHIAVVLYQPTEQWEVELAIRERAAENRLCLVACAAPGLLGATMILNPPLDSLWSPTRSAPYDGTINTPDAVVAEPDATELRGLLYPARSLQREISRDTDLVGGRAWQAAVELVT